MNRRDRLKWIATPAGMKAAARIQRERRGGLEHRFVVGGLRLVEGRIVLMAVEMGPARNILRPIQLTDQAKWFYRWRTRQAATQFRDRWGLPDTHVYDLAWADVIKADPAAGTGAFLVDAAASIDLDGRSTHQVAPPSTSRVIDPPSTRPPPRQTRAKRPAPCKSAK